MRRFYNRAPRWGAIQIPIDKGETKMTKYIVFWKYKPKNLAKIIEKSLKAQALAEKKPEKHAKYLFLPHHTGYCKGFSIIDVVAPEQITKSMVFWFPELEQKFVPLIDNQDLLKAYQETHK